MQAQRGLPGTCGISDERGRGRKRRRYWVSPSEFAVGLLFHAVSFESEDQLEGIPISATGFFLSLVLFSTEGTVLFPSL